MSKHSDPAPRVSRRNLLAGVGAVAAGGVAYSSLGGVAKPANAELVDGSTAVGLAEPNIGVDDRGEVIIGAYVPWGFAKPSPDCVPGNPGATSGYLSNRDIIGFSQTHVSGTGGDSMYGNFRITPMAGAWNTVEPATAIAAGSPKRDEVADPGYYKVTLTEPGGRAGAIDCELTATRICALHRYTFPPNKSGILLFDASSVINLPGGQRPLTCTVDIVGNNTIKMTGQFEGGWSDAKYKLYAVVKFSRNFTGFGTWLDDTREQNRQSAHTWNYSDVPASGKLTPGQKMGAYVTFDTAQPNPGQVVEVRIGLSWKSFTQAEANLTAEVGTGTGAFNAVKSKATRAWDECLDKIGVEGGSADQKKIFYSALMHAQAMPHDLRGEDVLGGSFTGEHYEDFYTLWDTFRTVTPLLTLIQPQRMTDMVKSLLNVYTATGWLPDGRIGGVNGYTQGGTNSDVVVTDAIIKGLITGNDATKGYQAMRKNADTDSGNVLRQGRNLEEYKEYGYLPYTDPAAETVPAWYAELKGVPRTAKLPWWYGRSASRTLEYAYNDFCIATVAGLRNDTAKRTEYLERAKSWQKLWNSSGKTIHPKLADGNWLPGFNKDTKYRDFAEPFYEGTGRQYSTFVPHDVQKLIANVGGNDAFIDWLDELFDGGYYNPGNEPDLLAAYLYIHAGAHYKTAERVRSLLKNEYDSTTAGLPENDDAGTISAWYVWGAMGLYPNAGQDLYYIGSPVFSKTTINLKNSKTFTIEAVNVSETAKFVQSATLNGQAYTKAWLKHGDILNDRTTNVLKLQMGTTRSAWGTGDANRPPSQSIG